MSRMFLHKRSSHRPNPRDRDGRIKQAIANRLVEDIQGQVDAERVLEDVKAELGIAPGDAITIEQYNQIITHPRFQRMQTRFTSMVEHGLEQRGISH